jgi:hypothetical protein
MRLTVHIEEGQGVEPGTGHHQPDQPGLHFFGGQRAQSQGAAKDEKGVGGEKIPHRMKKDAAVVADHQYGPERQQGLPVPRLKSISPE